MATLAAERMDMDDWSEEVGEVDLAPAGATDMVDVVCSNDE